MAWTSGERGLGRLVARQKTRPADARHPWWVETKMRRENTPRYRRMWEVGGEDEEDRTDSKGQEEGL